jgi:hypothetical protein
MILVKLAIGTTLLAGEFASKPTAGTDTAASPVVGQESDWMLPGIVSVGSNLVAKLNDERAGGAER